MKSFLDRAFYVTGVNNGMLRHKVGASVVAVRRSGGLPTFNQLNNFLVLRGNAAADLQLLERHPRHPAGRSTPGRRGQADHADAGQQHGLVDETGGTRQGNDCAAGKRGQDLYEFYPLRRAPQHTSKLSKPSEATLVSLWFPCDGQGETFFSYRSPCGPLWKEHARYKASG